MADNPTDPTGNEPLEPSAESPFEPNAESPFARDVDNTFGAGSPPPPPGATRRPGLAIPGTNFVVPWKLAIIGGAILAFAIIGFIASRGTTGAGNLSVGDCFENDTSDEVSKVKDQDCAARHDSQVVATFALTSYDSQAAVEQLVEVECDRMASSAITLVENIPADARIGYLFPSKDGYDDGEKQVTCYISSAAGIPGPLTSSAAGGE